MDRQGIRDGIRAIVPLALPGIPFGLVFGLTVSEATNVDTWAGWASSLLVVAGAAQIAAVGLLQDNAAIATVVLTVAVINARHVMYSAALSDRFRALPRWFRWLASYLLLDQIYAIAEQQDDDVTPEYRMGHYLGGVMFIYPMWLIATTVGLVAGNAIPADWSLDFSVPLMFLGLLVLGTKNSPGVLAAVVGGVVAVVGRDLPNGSGLLVGAVLGVLAGGLADWALEQRTLPEGNPT